VTTTAAAPDPDPGPDLFALAAELGRAVATRYPGAATYVVGTTPKGDEVLRLLCPVGAPEPRDDMAATVMQAVNEADGPRTMRELYVAVTGDVGEPTGAFKRAVRVLVAAGRLRELPGPPRAYDLP
jgi:hypothetical protein